MNLTNKNAYNTIRNQAGVQVSRSQPHDTYIVEHVMRKDTLIAMKVTYTTNGVDVVEILCAL